ncbi:MAG: tetratricopeptide (TPR) repeat protein [Flavobacteriales bacterium]
MAIATQLDAVLAPSTKLPTQNLLALEVYFRARFNGSKGTRQGFYDAVHEFEKSIEHDKNFAISYAELARHHLAQIFWSGLPAQSQMSLVQPLIERSLEIDPASSEDYTALAVLKKHQRDFNGAAKVFERAIELSPNSISSLTEYGVFLLWNLRQPYKAVDIFTKVITLSPNDDLADTNLVNALIDAGRFDEALSRVKAIIRRSPNFATAYSAKSDLHYWQGSHLVESQLALSKNLELDPDVPFNSMIMSTIYLMVGDSDLARDWLQYSIDLAPNSDNAKFAEALIGLQRGEHGSAIDVFLGGVSDQFAFPIFVFDSVTEALKVNRLDDVEQYYRRHYPKLFEDDAHIDATNFIPAAAIGRILSALGDSARAQSLLQKCLQVLLVVPYGGLNTRESDWKTRVYLALDHYDLAIQSFIEHVDSGQGSVTILTGDVYRPLYDRPKFQEALNRMSSRLADTRNRLKALEASGELITPDKMARPVPL